MYIIRQTSSNNDEDIYSKNYDKFTEILENKIDYDEDGLIKHEPVDRCGYITRNYDEYLIKHECKPTAVGTTRDTQEQTYNPITYSVILIIYLIIVRKLFM